MTDLRDSLRDLILEVLGSGRYSVQDVIAAMEDQVRCMRDEPGDSDIESANEDDPDTQYDMAIEDQEEEMTEQDLMIEMLGKAW